MSVKLSQNVYLCIWNLSNWEWTHYDDNYDHKKKF